MRDNARHMTRRKCEFDPMSSLACCSHDRSGLPRTVAPAYISTLHIRKYSNFGNFTTFCVKFGRVIAAAHAQKLMYRLKVWFRDRCDSGIQRVPFPVEEGRKDVRISAKTWCFAFHFLQGAAEPCRVILIRALWQNFRNVHSSTPEKVLRRKNY